MDVEESMSATDNTHVQEDPDEDASNPNGGSPSPLQLKTDNKTKEGKLISLFDDLKAILKSPEYDEDMRQELHASNPDYLEMIEKRKKDIHKSDHGIVIAGETSSGKSTLVNKILGKQIFKARNNESTSTICKIRNSEDVQIITEDANRESEVIHSPSDCHPKTAKGESKMRDILKTLTDLTVSKQSKQFRSVEISFPIPFLKGNTIIVDTPGIGGSGEVSEKVMEYLPNAVSFIFVINVGSAGGMQNDRLPKILRSLINHQVDNEMPCFDPQEVIFVTNKWDTIPNLTDDSSDEDENTRTWNNITTEIKRLWPTVKMENIFRMNLKDVGPGMENYSQKEFEKFRECLEKVIKANENIRIAHNFRYLQGLLMNVIKALEARLELGKRSEQEQKSLAEDHQKKIRDLKIKCSEKKRKLEENVKHLIEEKAQECYDYMSTNFGKDRILNPQGYLPILDVPTLLTDEVKERVDLYVSRALEDETLQEKFLEIKTEAEDFHKETSMELEGIENDWTRDESYDQGDGQEISMVPVVAGAIATSPLWIPLLAIGIVMATAVGGVVIVASPIILPVMMVLNRESRKKKIINEQYENCREVIRSEICNQLESRFGEIFNKFINNITNKMLPERIAYVEMLIKQLTENRQQILANQESLKKLRNKIKEVEKKAKDI